QAAEVGIELDQDKARGRNALRNQRLGHWPSAGPKLDHRPARIRVHIACHAARQHASRRCHRTDRQGVLDPGPDEAHFVVESDAVSFLKPANAALYRLFQGAALALEKLDLLLELLFQELQGLQRHRGERNKSMTVS